MCSICHLQYVTEIEARLYQSPPSQALMQWIGAVQERNIPINGPIVQEKALEFAECMGLKDFSASGGWLDRFKKRENIDFKERNCLRCQGLLVRNCFTLSVFPQCYYPHLHLACLFPSHLLESYDGLEYCSSLHTRKDDRAVRRCLLNHLFNGRMKRVQV